MRKFFLPVLLAGILPWPSAFAEPDAPAAASDAARYGADFFQTFSADPVELPADSALRHELFDTIRASIPPGHKFKGSLKVYRNWAFFTGETVDAKGETVYDSESQGGACAALWLRTGEGERTTWTVVNVAICAPFDLPYRLWPYRYNAPYLLMGLDPALGQSGANVLP